MPMSTAAPFSSRPTPVAPHAPARSAKGRGTLLALLASGATTGLSVADDVGQPPSSTIPAGGTVAAAKALGDRALATLNRATVLSTVVVATDEASYLDAISRWTPTRRFPVLLDDGTPASAEAIGRFVRGFAPSAVYAYTMGAPPEEARNGLVASLRFDRAAGRAWGMSSDTPQTKDILAHWDSIGHIPPGVIVSDPRDGAWTAAVAIAAARGQPILWETLPGSINAVMDVSDARAFCTRVETFCDASHHAWSGLGDQIDAVTICAAMPIKVQVGQTPAQGNKPAQRETVALTDLIGRHRDAPGATRQGRWAWAGQVHGSPSQAAYRAMSALFLSPRSAWIFDSYTEEGPWQSFNGADAGAALNNAGWSVDLDDAPNATAHAWRAVASRPINASLILVTSMGNATFFELGRGDRCSPGDIPILDTPAMLHFVHSWSLLSPAKPDTVGARWLDRGVYAYAGSVQEPTLTAFVPTPLLAQRMLAGLPWGAAARVDDSPAWRIAILGDPLITLGPAPLREDGPLPIEDAVDLDSDLRDAVRSRDFARALRLMTLLARQDDAARLARAILADSEQSFTPEVASLAALPAFRAGDLELLARAHQRMAPDEAASPRVADALWNLARREIHAMEKQARDNALDILRTAVRPEQPAADGIELTQWLRRYRTRAEAEAFAQTVRPLLRQPRDQKDLDAALNGRE